MNKLRRSLTICMVAAVAMGLGVSQASGADTEVDVELSLVVDVSGSIDSVQFNKQRDGYVQAFNSSALSTAIANGTLGSIAVNLVYWSVGQVEAVRWTLIDGTPGNTASDFATLIAAAPQPANGTLTSTLPGSIDPAFSAFTPIVFGTQTGLANAIEFSANGFAANGFLSATRIIDVSSDGGDNASGRVGFSVGAEQMDPEDWARMAAVHLDVLGKPGEATPGALVDIINGLALGTEVNVGQPGDLVQYYTDNVVGVNPNWVQPASLNIEAPGFVIGVPEGLGNEEKFNEAVLQKLTGVPEPATMSLVLIGGIGALLRRRRRSAAWR